MKKTISAIIMTAILALAVPTFAQTRYYNGYNNTYRTRQSSGRSYTEQRYYGNDRYGIPQSNAYDRHRKAANIGIGVGAGALLGAFLGGKKGALIGAAIGAAGGAVVTAKQAPRNYYRRY